MKSWKKWGKVGKMGKSGLKWGKVGKSGEKLENVGKNWEKWEKVGKSAESGEKLEKVGKSSEKWEKWERWESVLFKKFGQNGRRRPFWMSENNFRSQFLPFQIDTQLFFFLKFLDWTTMSVIELVRDIWMNNACVKFEERSLNPSKVIALTTK